MEDVSDAYRKPGTSFFKAKDTLPIIVDALISAKEKKKATVVNRGSLILLVEAGCGGGI